MYAMYAISTVLSPELWAIQLTLKLFLTLDLGVFQSLGQYIPGKQPWDTPFFDGVN